MASPSSNPIPALFKRAMAAQNGGQPELARALYRQILGINRKLPEVHFQLGRLEMGLGQPRNALKHLARAREIRPGEPAIWTVTMDALIALEDRKGAARLLREAKTAGLSAQVRRELANKAEGGNRAGVARLGQVDPAEFQAATKLFAAGRFAEAEAAAAALHARHPKVAPVLTVLAAAQAALGRTGEAVASYRRATVLDPSYPEARLQLGQVLSKLGENAEAATELERAHALMPASPHACRFLGLVYWRLERFADALPLLESTRGALPEDPEFLFALAASALECGNPQAAREVIDTLLAGGEPAFGALMLLGRALAELGENDEARAAYEKALELEPESVPALTALAQLCSLTGDFEATRQYARRVCGMGVADGALFRIYAATTKISRDDPCLRLMEEAFAAGRELPGTRAEAAFALAKAAENTGSHGAVFEYLREGNDLLHADYPIGESRSFRPWEYARRAFERGIAPGRKSATVPRAIFVTSMPRSGTTLVEQILASHSQVAAGGELGRLRERLVPLLELADAEGRAPRAEELCQCGEAAAAEYGEIAPGAPVVTDKAIITYQFLGLLGAAMPGARAVVVRRDPRDTCLSIYKNFFQPGTHRYSTDLRALGNHYLRFLEILDYWREHSPGSFYELRYEELIANPEEQARALVAACGLEWEDGCLAFYENRRRVDTLSAYQVRQPIYSSSVGAWKRYEQELGPLIEVLEKGGALD